MSATVPEHKRSPARRSRSGARRGVSPARARALILALPGVEEGRSYGMPAFLVGGRFLARLRDENTVLVLRLSSIIERDVLMHGDSEAFFVTDHYRNYPAVLVRLARTRASVLRDVLRASWEHVASQSPRGPRRRA